MRSVESHSASGSEKGRNEGKDGELYIYIYVCVCVCVCMYVCMYVCVYVCILTYNIKLRRSCRQNETEGFSYLFCSYKICRKQNVTVYLFTIRYYIL